MPPEKPAEEPETFKQSFYMQNDYYEPIIPKILPVASAYVHPAAPKETDSDLESSTSKHSEIEHATNVFRLSREHIIRNPAPPLNQNMKLLNLEGRLTIEDEMRASPMRRSLKALDY